MADDLAVRLGDQRQDIRTDVAECIDDVGFRALVEARLIHCADHGDVLRAFAAYADHLLRVQISSWTPLCHE